MFETRFKIVGMSVYGTPVLRIRNGSGRGIEVELHALRGAFAWKGTAGPGDTHVELPCTAAYVASTAEGSCTLHPPADLPLHDGPIHERACRPAQGLPRGTRVRTLFGEVAVETLRIGDPVFCRDKDHRSLRWLARSGHGDTAAYHLVLGCSTQVATAAGWAPALGPEAALSDLPGDAREALLAANPQMRFTPDSRPALPVLDPAEFSYRIEMA